MPARKKKSTIRSVRTVSVPSALDERMREAGDINWSFVAARAFARELQAIARKADMTTVLDRLRRSKEQASETEYDEGHETGRRWAELTAEYAELRRLAKLENKLGSDFRYAVLRYGGAELANEILGSPDADVNEFWKGISNTAEPDKQAWRFGFVDGALEIWAEVADQL